MNPRKNLDSRAESSGRGSALQSVDRGDVSTSIATSTDGFVVWLDSQRESRSDDLPMRGVVERMIDSKRLPFDSIEALADVFRQVAPRNGRELSSRRDGHRE